MGPGRTGEARDFLRCGLQSLVAVRKIREKSHEAAIGVLDETNDSQRGVTLS